MHGRSDFYAPGDHYSHFILRSLNFKKDEKFSIMFGVIAQKKEGFFCNRFYLLNFEFPISAKFQNYTANDE